MRFVLCRDLHPGDLLLKLLPNRLGAFAGDAAVAVDGLHALEARAAGLATKALDVVERERAYVVFRPASPAHARRAAAAARRLFEAGPLSYESPGVPPFLLERILAARGQPFFRSQFVVAVYELSFRLSDAKLIPSVLASRLVDHPRFAVLGYMPPRFR